MSCAVPDRALDPAQRVAARAAPPAARTRRAARRRRSRTACPAWWPARRRCGCARPCTSSACSAARRASRASTRDRPVAHVLQREPDLQLLDVLGEVAAGHALVHVLVPGERAELLDPRLDVVAGDPLARGDGGEVDLLDDALVVRDRLLGDVDAEVALRPQHRDPQPALQHDLVLRRPQRDELGARVARGEDVGDHVAPTLRGELGEQRGAGGRARVRVGLDEAVHDGAVDDGDEPWSAAASSSVSGAGEDRGEQRVELAARRAHQRRQVGPPCRCATSRS